MFYYRNERNIAKAEVMTKSLDPENAGTTITFKDRFLNWKLWSQKEID